MGDRAHIGARVPEEISEGVEQLAHEFGVSKSEIIREILRDSILESDRADRLPEEIRAKLRREQRKSRNEIEWQRIHFPSNCKDRVVRAWKQGDLNPEINPGSLSDLMQIYREDAKDLFADQPDRLERVLSYLDSLEEQTRAAESASDLDPLDPEEIYSEFSGVDRTQIGDSDRQTEQLDESESDPMDQERSHLLRLVREQIERQQRSEMIVLDREAAVRAVAKRFGVGVEDLLDAARAEGILDE